MKTEYLADQVQSMLRPVRRESGGFPGQGTVQSERGTRRSAGARASRRGDALPGTPGLEIHEIWEEKRGDAWVTCILGREDGVPVGLVIDARGRAYANGGTTLFNR